MGEGRSVPTLGGRPERRRTKMRKKPPRREGEYAELPRVQATGIDPETGERLAAADPRSGEPASVGQGRAAAQGARSSLPKTGGPPIACLAGSPLLRWLAACR